MKEIKINCINSQFLEDVITRLIEKVLEYKRQTIQHSKTEYTTKHK